MGRHITAGIEPWRAHRGGLHGKRGRVASDAARRHVTEYLAVTADENDAVSGGVALVPFQFPIGDGNSRPIGDDTLAIGDDGDIFVAANLETISFRLRRSTTCADCPAASVSGTR